MGAQRNLLTVLLRPVWQQASVQVSHASRAGDAGATVMPGDGRALALYGPADTRQHWECVGT